MKCSKCNAEIAENARFCPVCGTKVESKNKCPNCGEKLKDGAKFCTKCGTKIENWTEEKDVPSPTSEQTVADIIEPIINEHNEEPSVNTSKPLTVSKSSSMAVKKNKSSKKTIIIAVVVAVIVVALVSVLVVVLNSGSSSNYRSYSNSSLSNTYSNRYISFKYPSNYQISYETENEYGEINLICLIDNSDISQITIVCGEDEALYFLDDKGINKTCKDVLKNMNDEVNDIFNFSAMSKKTIGNCSGYSSNFTGELLSCTVKGYTFVGISGYYYVTIFTQAENDKYMSQLDDILSTLDVKAIALGIGDIPDDDM
ncbi:MAG: zinc ribbon domain-containing protein [Bacteroidales bacterium]|nr:zinc ribbon domain-containing protein [Bacteroidales bacterium]